MIKILKFRFIQSFNTKIVKSLIISEEVTQFLITVERRHYILISFSNDGHIPIWSWYLLLPRVFVLITKMERQFFGVSNFACRLLIFTMPFSPLLATISLVRISSNIWWLIIFLQTLIWSFLTFIFVNVAKWSVFHFTDHEVPLLTNTVGLASLRSFLFKA